MIDFVEVNGITFTLNEDGSLKSTIHIKDFITAISSLTARPNGTVVLVARKRWKNSDKGLTHYKPFFKQAAKCEDSRE